MADRDTYLPMNTATTTHNNSDSMTEGLICALIFAGLLLILAVRMNSLPVVFISSIGWTVAGLQLYDQTAEVLPMMLLFMVAVAQFFLVKGDAA